MERRVWVSVSGWKLKGEVSESGNSRLMNSRIHLNIVKAFFKETQRGVL